MDTDFKNLKKVLAIKRGNYIVLTDNQTNIQFVDHVIASHLQELRDLGLQLEDQSLIQQKYWYLRQLFCLRELKYCVENLPRDSQVILTRKDSYQNNSTKVSKNPNKNWCANVIIDPNISGKIQILEQNSDSEFSSSIQNSLQAQNFSQIVDDVSCLSKISSEEQSKQKMNKSADSYLLNSNPKMANGIISKVKSLDFNSEIQIKQIKLSDLQKQNIQGLSLSDHQKQRLKANQLCKKSNFQVDQISDSSSEKSLSSHNSFGDVFYKKVIQPGGESIVKSKSCSDSSVEIYKQVIQPEAPNIKSSSSFSSDSSADMIYKRIIYQGQRSNSSDQQSKSKSDSSAEINKQVIQPETPERKSSSSYSSSGSSDMIYKKIIYQGKRSNSSENDSQEVFESIEQQNNIITNNCLENQLQVFNEYHQILISEQSQKSNTIVEQESEQNYEINQNSEIYQNDEIPQIDDQQDDDQIIDQKDYFSDDQISERSIDDEPIVYELFESHQFILSKREDQTASRGKTQRY